MKVYLTDSSFKRYIHVEYLTSGHDVTEYIRWLRCQFSTDIYIKVESSHMCYNGVYSPLNYTHVPPRPLLLNIKKMRRREKREKGYYYGTLQK